MAFKILNDDEISWLNDTQRLQYEKELDLYNQRSTFVEWVEEFENITVEPYEPKLKSIAVIDEIEVKSFKKPDYILAITEVVSKPKIQVNPFEKVERVKPILPSVAKQCRVQVKQIQKPESTKPELPLIKKLKFHEKNFVKSQIKSSDLPEIIKPKITVKSSTKMEKVQSNLPTIPKPSVKTTMAFENIKKHENSEPKNMPKVSTPNIGRAICERTGAYFYFYTECKR